MKTLKTLSKITLTFTLLMFLAPAAFSQMEITDDGVKDRVSVSIYPNLSEGKAMLKWEEGSIDYIEIMIEYNDFSPISCNHLMHKFIEKSIFIMEINEKWRILKFSIFGIIDP